MTNEAAQEIWRLQGELFEKQRSLIEYLSRFTPPQYVEDVNVRISNINNTLNKIKAQEAL
jgi:hypothetical protein